MRCCMLPPGLGFLKMPVRHCADWNFALTIWEWVKIIATALAISVAMTAVGAAALWVIAK